MTFALQTIYNRETQHESEYVKSNLTFAIAQRAMKAARLKAIPSCSGNIDQVIADFDEGRVDEFYQEMYLGSVHHDFRRRDQQGTSRKHAMIFVNRSIMEDVQRTCNWFSMDGTFKITPKISNDLNDRAAQVLIIATDYHGSIAVLFLVVMQSRKLPLYKKVFRFIKNSAPSFQPAQMMSDFERAMRKGFRFAFIESRLYGCR